MEAEAGSTPDESESDLEEDGPVPKGRHPSEDDEQRSGASGSESDMGTDDRSLGPQCCGRRYACSIPRVVILPTVGAIPPSAVFTEAQETRARIAIAIGAANELATAQANPDPSEPDQSPKFRITAALTPRREEPSTTHHASSGRNPRTSSHNLAPPTPAISDRASSLRSPSVVRDRLTVHYS